MANIKYIGETKGDLEKGKIHIKNADGTTGCGKVWNDNPEAWVTTSESVNCQKNGCK